MSGLFEPCLLSEESVAESMLAGEDKNGAFPIVSVSGRGRDTTGEFWLSGDFRISSRWSSEADLETETGFLCSGVLSDFKYLLIGR